MSKSIDRARLFASALIGGTAVCAAALLAPVPASAKSMKECGAEYQAAKTAGTLNGEGWQAFRASHCSAGATAAAAPAAPATTAPAAPAPTASAPTASTPAPATTAAAPAATAATAAGGAAVFPTAVSGKYSTLSAGKARMNTCLDQYKANKANNGNGALKWIQKGGGYYSECNKRLKGG